MDTKELQKEIQKLKEKNEELLSQLSGLELLKEDRKVLVAQVNEAAEKIEALTAENRSLRAENDELRDKLKQKDPKPAGQLSTTPDSQPTFTWAATRPNSNDDKNQKFQESFHLPPTEFELSSYRGSYERKIVTGKIHVTPNWVIFRKTNTLFGSNEDLKIAFSDIEKIEKPYKHEHSINVTTKEGKLHHFRAIIHGRDTLVEELIKQHKLITLKLKTEKES